MKEKGLAWVPTITPYTRAAIRSKQKFEADPTPENEARCKVYGACAEAYRNHFKELYDTGVTVGAGTDLSLDEGDGAPVAGELKYMVEYGISPMEAIRVGTANGAAILGISDETGMLKEGLAADLLVVRGNPGMKIEDLENVEAVWRNGVLAI